MEGATWHPRGVTATLEGRRAARLPAARLPFPVRAPYRTSPAPRPIEGPPLVIDDAWPTHRLRRLERLRDDPDGVLVRDPSDPDDVGLSAALQEAHRLLRDAHGRLDRGRARNEPPDPAGSGGTCLTDATLAGLDGDGPLASARAFLLGCSDDLVVLRRRGPGRATAELLAVSFPSGWPPRERAGADLPTLHAPVADSGRLLAASHALSEALLTKGPYSQHVWGLDPDGRLDRDPSAPDAAPGPHSGAAVPPPQHWWLRVERQTSIPLPALDRALFLIRPYLVPLPSLDRGQRLAIRDAVTSMSPAALAYKGLTGIRDDLLTWLTC